MALKRSTRRFIRRIPLFPFIPLVPAAVILGNLFLSAFTLRTVRKLEHAGAPS